MKAVDSDGLFCDFMQFYHVDPDSISLRKAAVLACGLPEDSRIKIALRNQKVASRDVYIIGLLDALNMLTYLYMTRNFEGSFTKPESLMAKLMGKTVDSDIRDFDSPEEWEAERRRIIGG